MSLHGGDYMQREKKNFMNQQGLFIYTVMIELVGTIGDTHARGIERPRVVKRNF